MANGRKYWLSPQRGLPPPTGRLAGEIAYPEMGAFEEPWPEEEGSGGGLPAPLYLQSRAESLDVIQQAARVQRFLQQANERTRLAHGPGASGGLPPTEYLDTGAGTPSVSPPGSAFPQPPPPLIARPGGASQVYGAQRYAQTSHGAADPWAGSQEGMGSGGLRPGMRPLPWAPEEAVHYDVASAYDTAPAAPWGSAPAGPSGDDATRYPQFAGFSASAPATKGTVLPAVPGAGVAAGLPIGLQSPAVASTAYARQAAWTGRPGGYSGGAAVGGDPSDPDNPGYFAMQQRREWIAEQQAGQYGALGL